MMVDYRALLAKYIAHVIDCEGTDFLGFHRENYSAFTAEEYAELKAIGDVEYEKYSSFARR